VFAFARRISVHPAESLIYAALDAHYSSDSLRDLSFSSSFVSGSGDEITYWPLAHLPRSMVRHRSLQKGNSALLALTAFLQIGQRSRIARFRAIVPCPEDFRLKVEMQVDETHAFDVATGVSPAIMFSMKTGSLSCWSYRMAALT
jgi:hypothetical protein